MKKESLISNVNVRSPKILILDIETAPIIAYIWNLFEETNSLDQIKSDWHIMSWAAKWLDSDKIMYMDQRNAKDIENDKEILKPIWNLIDEADIVVTQNGVQFDMKKLNARFILNDMKPPSGYKNIDTRLIAKSKFAFTSNKLEYMTDKLNKKYKKLKHSKFAGINLWKECLKGNLKAWKEMEKYNKHDVLATEELYKRFRAWDNVNLNVYHDKTKHICSCGCEEFNRKGYHYTATGKFMRYCCKNCGKSFHDKENLLSTKKKRTLKRN